MASKSDRSGVRSGLGWADVLDLGRLHRCQITVLRSIRRQLDILHHIPKDIRAIHDGRRRGRLRRLRNRLRGVKRRSGQAGAPALERERGRTGRHGGSSLNRWRWRRLHRFGRHRNRSRLHWLGCRPGTTFSTFSPLAPASSLWRANSPGKLRPPTSDVRSC